MAYTAVRDDPILAAARGLATTPLRLSAFAISAAMSAAVGVLFAHYQTVVCPAQMDIYIMELLLIMVFVGGRGSLRGVVLAAVVFTVLPEYLRVAAAWRVVVFGALLLFVVTFAPGGFEQGFRTAERLLARRSRRPGESAPAKNAEPTGFTS
jgi:ABC-type branched-subunit amino acid transport system permease subunit